MPGDDPGQFSLCCLRVFNNLLLMATMFYPDEVRPAEALSGQIKEPSLHPNGITMANSLIEISPPFSTGEIYQRIPGSLMELIKPRLPGRKWRSRPPRKRQRWWT